MPEMRLSEQPHQLNRCEQSNCVSTSSASRSKLASRSAFKSTAFAPCHPAQRSSGACAAGSSNMPCTKLPRI